MSNTTTKLSLDEVLNEFLSTDNLKPDLQKPHLKDGFVYGSNGHIAIKIPEARLFTRYLPGGKYPDVERVLNQPLLPESIILVKDQIREVLNQLPLHNKYAPCALCDEGSLECNLGHVHDCNACDGLGNSTVIVGKEYSYLDLIKIGNAHYNPNYIELIEKVCICYDIELFTIISQSYNTAMVALLEDITILIMPVGYSAEPEKYKEYILKIK